MIARFDEAAPGGGGGGGGGDVLAFQVTACRDAMAVAGTMYGLGRAARRAALKAVQSYRAESLAEMIDKGATRAEAAAYERTFADALDRCVAANRDGGVVRFSFVDERTGARTPPETYAPATAAEDWRPWRERHAGRANFSS